jgi:hypothetical protein
MNMLFADTVRELALENLRASGATPGDASELGRALLQALVQAGVDLSQGPTLEEMKSLLSEVTRLASRDAEQTAA